jgi:hypothetical protein
MHHICDQLFSASPQKIISQPISVPSAHGQSAELSLYKHVHFFHYEDRCFDELRRGSLSATEIDAIQLIKSIDNCLLKASCVVCFYL